MAMTAAVKDELSRVNVSKACCRKAEVAALLRFASALHLVGGRIVIEADVDAGAIARRLKRELTELYAQECEVVLVQPAGLRKGSLVGSIFTGMRASFSAPRCLLGFFCSMPRFRFNNRGSIT